MAAKALWRHSRTLVVNALAVGALLTVALDLPPLVPVALLVACIALIVSKMKWRLVRRPGLGVLGAFGAARLLLAATVLALVVSDDGVLATPLAACLLALTITTEPVMARSWRPGSRLIHALPGAPGRPVTSRWGGWYVALSLVQLILLALSIWMPRLVKLLIYTVVVVLALSAALGILLSQQAKGSRGRQVRDAIDRYQPEIMVYLSGPPGTEYQLSTWIPYLEALDRRLLVVVREGALAGKVARITRLPVVSCSTLKQVEESHVPSLRVALYVNNGAKNSHNIRYRDVTHVQLLHGESDKPASYNPVTVMFDKIFVAGQAGIDRYAQHGVVIPPEKFEIVGRPQVSNIERPEPKDAPTTALYAPTWTGFQADTNYGSLPAGPAIIDALLSRGLTVTFRPHPYSRRDARSRQAIRMIENRLRADTLASGRQHVFGSAASAELTLVDCFNTTDMLVTDVSSVPADYLFSEKPFIILKMYPLSDEEFVTDFPLARAAYLADGSDGNAIVRAVSAVLDDDVLATTRRELRTYYLGDLPFVGYEQTFLQSIRTLVDAGPQAGPKDTVEDPEDDEEATVDVSNDSLIDE